MELSVVIPVLNEQARMKRCLDHVTGIEGVTDVVVVDGGSDDDTKAIARAHGRATVVAASRGRAVQMNAGAAHARGDTLVFLHADVELPEGAASVVRRILDTPGVVAGAFRTWHVAERWRQGPRAWLLHLADVRSRYSTLPYGDQGLFVRADRFHRMGGFPLIPLMEDLAFARRLRGAGRVVIADESVRVSGRRFESASVYQTLLVNVFPILYSAGVAPAVLARLYGDPR